MNKIQESVKNVRSFIGEVTAEMGKCTWPERQELMGSTLVVIVSVLLMSVFVGLSDRVLVGVLRLLIRVIQPG